MAEDYISFAVKNELTPSQLVAYLLIRKDNLSATFQFATSFGEPSKEDFKVLIEKNLIMTLDNNNPNIANSRINKTKQAQTQENLMEMAEELWKAYPAAFPLSDGGMFIARKGTDKIEILKMYLERIKNSPEKHEFVLQQLRVFIKLVSDRKINGLRIHEWISNEMWDSMPAIKAASRGEFKTDIN